MVQLYKRKGGEVLVNTETLNTQMSANIAILPGGGFVVTWHDGSFLGGDASGFSIKAQLFDADGNKVGTEFLVNTTVAANQVSPVVTALASGRFAITWTDASVTGGDTSNNAVRGQLYEANGTLVGTEFLVNTATNASQATPSISDLAGGGFVVSWTDASGVGGDASGSGIKAQIFDAAGVKVGGEILVNTEIAGNQGPSSIIALGTGFAVAWQGATTFPGGQAASSVRLQLFDASGARVGTEQVVNAGNDGSFANVNINALASGFIITWSQQDAASIPGVTTTFDVRAQLYDAGGAKVGTEFVVNSSSAGSQSAADVDMLPGGLFLVTWQGSTVGAIEFNIYGQVFDSTGARVGTEFIVNSMTDGSQIGARVDVLASGDIVILWQDSSGDQDASGSGVKMQILTLSTDAPTDIALSSSLVSETAREDMPLITLSTTGAVNSTFTYELLADSSGGAFRIEGDRLVVADASLLDFATAAQVTLTIRTTDLNGLSYQETIQLQVGDTPEGVYDAGAEFQVNTTVAENQSEPFLTPLTNGGFLAAWLESPLMGGEIVTKGQLYDQNGDPVGGELTLGDMTAVTGLPGGTFVTATVAPDVNGDGIFLQFHDATGATVGAPFQANTTTAGNQMIPALTALAGGGFVATWTDAGATIETVRGQRFDAAGNKVGAEFLVPGVGGGVQDITALTGGGFVVAWQGDGIEAQIFAATGLRHGPQLSVSEFSSTDTHVAALADGGFVIVWSGRVDVDGDIDHFAVGAQIYDAHGNKVGGQVLVHDDTPDQILSLDVAALPWGGFLVSWAVEDAPPSDTGIRAQVFDGTGAPVGAALVVTDATGAQVHPDVIVLASGEIVIAWSDFGAGDGSGAAVRARIFSLPEPAGPTEGPDVLNGTADADTIDGLGGDDVINGLGGDDVLNGGAGADQLNGGTGNDTCFVDNVADQTIEATGGGTDIVYAGLSYELTAGASIEILSPDSLAGTAALTLVGNALVQLIYGNAGANLLTGGGGADQLAGLGGDDTYIITDGSEAVFEAAGGGNDIVYTSVSHALAGGQEIELLSTAANGGTDALDLTGNEYANTIYGNDGINNLRGGGGTGDKLIGLGGNDVYFIVSGSEQLFEAAGGGSDVVYTNLGHALVSGQEIEILSAISNAATTAMDLTGNELANLIYANDGVNNLRGGGGADVLVGYGGNDVYYIVTGTESAIEAGGGGTDVVYTNLSYALGAGQELEILAAVSQSATTAMDLTGNAFANQLYGNDGANVLNGGAGADFMLGYGGADSFAFTTALGAGNVDAIGDFLSGTDRIALDDAIFTGIGGPGALGANAFVTGTQAGDADDRIIYNSTTGALLFDADGNGGGAAVQFATLQTGLTLTASDFVVI